MSGQSREGHSSWLLTNPTPTSTMAADVPLPSAGFAAIGGLQDSQSHPAALCSPSAASWGRLEEGNP